MGKYFNKTAIIKTKLNLPFMPPSTKNKTYSKWLKEYRALLDTTKVDPTGTKLIVKQGKYFEKTAVSPKLVSRVLDARMNHALYVSAMHPVRQKTTTQLSRMYNQQQKRQASPTSVTISQKLSDAWEGLKINR